MRRVGVVALLVTLALVAVTAGTASTTEKQLEFSANPTHRVYQPASLPTDEAVPVVLVIHGGFGTGAGATPAIWETFDAHPRQGP